MALPGVFTKQQTIDASKLMIPRNGYLYLKIRYYADLVVCVDVMEHIEPMLLVNVILHLRQLTIKRLLVAISLRAAGKRLRDGRNAHLIIESASWWAEQMRRGFKIHRVRPSNPDEWVAELIPKET